MRKLLTVSGLALLTSIGAILAGCSKPETSELISEVHTPDLCIHGATVYTGEGAAISNGVITATNGMIESVSAGDETNACAQYSERSTQILNLNGDFIYPGFEHPAKIAPILVSKASPLTVSNFLITPLHKIGMHHTVLETDWDGDFILSSQVWTTARDLARLGQLYLNEGEWDGKRILPKNWAEYVATPAPAQPTNRQGDNATKPGRGYGAQFWLYENYPGVPEGTYAALGNRGQFVIIVPSHNVVIVRRGYDYSGQRFDGPAFTADILKTLQPTSQ